VKDPITFWLGSDFTFVIICLLSMGACGAVLLFFGVPRRESTKARRAHRRYDDGYVAELLAGGTILPVWNCTAAPCSHDDWTRAFDVIMKGGDDVT
jgi:hypothetical protein